MQYGCCLSLSLKEVIHIILQMSVSTVRPCLLFIDILNIEISAKLPGKEENIMKWDICRIYIKHSLWKDVTLHVTPYHNSNLILHTRFSEASLPLVLLLFVKPLYDFFVPFPFPVPSFYPFFPFWNSAYWTLTLIPIFLVFPVFSVFPCNCPTY